MFKLEFNQDEIELLRYWRFHQASLHRSQDHPKDMWTSHLPHPPHLAGKAGGVSDLVIPAV